MEASLGTALLFGSMLFFIALGLPIAFVLGGMGVLFMWLLAGTQGLFMVVSTAYGKGTDFLLVALPLFILMGNFLEVSGIADSLYGMIHRWVGRFPGGLASGTMVICAIFAAMAGISGAATVTMGLVAIPSMLNRRYDKRLVLGTIASGGALGILIPPSIIAIIYASVTGVSVSKLYSGCMIPGIILAGLFIVYITVRCLIQPNLGPPTEERFTWREKISSLKAVVFPVIIIVLVLGTMYAGICTATEAAALGAFGTAIACAIHRKLTWENVKLASQRSIVISAMCLWIVFGAFCFSRAYSLVGGADLITKIVLGLPIPPMGVIWAMMIIWFILGCFMETAGICLITVPVFMPIVDALGFDPYWFGVLFVVDSEMGLLTPPFGMTLFWLKGVVPPGITLFDIYRSIWPFVAVQGFCLILIMYTPQLALWLPSLMK